MKKLKLCIVDTSSINGSHGGVAPFMKNLDPYLKDAFDVTYLVLPDYTNKIKFIPKRLILMLYLMKKRREIKNSNVILSHTPEGSFVVSFAPVPFVHIFHGNFNPMTQSRFWYGKYFKFFFQLFEKRIIKKASLLYTVGNDRQGIPKILNPIHNNVKFKNIDSRTGFIFSGRLEKIKNIDKIITVYSKLNRSIQERNSLFIAGMGTQEAKLKQHAASLPIYGKVIFMGNLSNEDVIEAVSSKKIHLMASSQEGFPMAIAEALSASVPVIATDTGDIARFLKSDYNGFLLPVAFSDEEYIMSIEKILNDYERFSKNAFASSSVFKADLVAKGLADDINKALAKKV